MNTCSTSPESVDENINIEESVYIVYLRESILLSQNVYKIGRTSGPILKRMNGYPKGSALMLHVVVVDSRQVEQLIKLSLRNKFHQRTDMGIEYFEGNYVDIRTEFMKISDGYRPIPIHIPKFEPLQCSKCMKKFNRIYHVIRHEIKCDGWFNKKQCKICLRLFTTQQGKWKHVHTVQCTPKV